MRPHFCTTRWSVEAIHNTLDQLAEEWPEINSIRVLRVTNQVFMNDIFDRSRNSTTTGIARHLGLANSTVHSVLQDACLGGGLKGVMDKHDGRKTYYVTTELWWPRIRKFSDAHRGMRYELLKKGEDNDGLRGLGPCQACRHRVPTHNIPTSQLTPLSQ